MEGKRGRGRERRERGRKGRERTAREKRFERGSQRGGLLGEVCWNLPLLFFPLAWLERRLPDGTPEGALCSLPPIPTPTLSLLTPFQSDHIPGKLESLHQSLEPCSPSPSPKGGRKPELKPQRPDSGEQPGSVSQLPATPTPGSTPEDQQLSPPLLGLSAPILLSGWKEWRREEGGARRARGQRGRESRPR